MSYLEIIFGVLKQSSCSKQHGGMSIMTTGMHFTIDFAFMLPIHQFLQFESIGKVLDSDLAAILHPFDSKFYEPHLKPS